MQAYTAARKQGKGKEPKEIKLLAEQILQGIREEDLDVRERRAETVRLLAPGR